MRAVCTIYPARTSNSARSSDNGLITHYGCHHRRRRRFGYCRCRPSSSTLQTTSTIVRLSVYFPFTSPPFVAEQVCIYARTQTILNIFLYRITSPCPTIDRVFQTKRTRKIGKSVSTIRLVGEKEKNQFSVFAFVEKNNKNKKTEEPYLEITLVESCSPADIDALQTQDEKKKYLLPIELPQWT